jgi:ArsR family transcriptional regulator
MRMVEYIALVTLEASNRWDLYRALSEPARLRLLALVAEEELTVGELADLLGESQPNASRYVAALRQAGLLEVRRQGTRALVSWHASDDPVVLDALASGRTLAGADGSLGRVAELVRARDAATRDYFERARATEVPVVSPEIAAYLPAIAPLLPRRRIAVDAGTGDGGLLELLAPLFGRVVAVDRSEAQLALARARVRQRGWGHVSLVRGEIAGAEVRSAVGQEGADAVFAVRLLHHAPRPADVVGELAGLAAPGGAVVVLDYAAHDDESMREQADVWLGFERAELEGFADAAHLEDVHVTPVPGFARPGPGPMAARGTSPDAHLPWQVLVGRKRRQTEASERTTRRRGNHHG